MSLVPDLQTPGTLPWHAFRAILEAWPHALRSDWNKVALAYVDAHLVPRSDFPEAMQRRRRHDVTQALVAEIRALARGGWV